MKNKILLVLIIILAFVLRFYRLDTFPALNADEAAIGYNAWSLLQTGMDEHGNSWPLHFQSFNDYKPGLMFYIVLPFVKVLGLTVWAVRIPGALAGVATVFVVYFLVKEILCSVQSDKKNKLEIENYQSVPLISAFMLAISPWHIHFSRGGWEVNVATFFITTGIWLFLKSLSSQFDLKYLVVSIFLFILSFYTYHSARVIVPLLGFGFALIYWKEFLLNWKKTGISIVIAGVLLLPLLYDFTTGAVLSRASGVSIFADSGTENEINEQRGEHEDLGGISARLLHNKPLNYSLTFFENWMEHFSGDFLFISGDEIQRNKVPEHGQMYLYDIIFVIFGLWAIAKFSKRWKPILLWLLIAPVAAALTFQSPHALRAQNMVIPLVIISAIGLEALTTKIREIFKNKNAYIVWCIACGGIILWSFARYQQHYWIYMPNRYPFSSQYGVSELMDYVEEKYNDYNRILITDRYDQPYILTLFYLHYPPSNFQNEHELSAPDGYGFSTVRFFDKFKFRRIEWPELPERSEKTLVIGTPKEIPDTVDTIEIIYFPSGEEAFRIVEI